MVRAGLQDLAAIQLRDDVPVLLVIFPMLLDLRAYPFEALHQRISSEARSAGLAVLDLLDAFLGDDEARLRRSPFDSVHPNAEAHRIAAERIHAHLRQARLIPDR
jgi:lysophospholipase L1-like esterase